MSLVGQAISWLISSAVRLLSLLARFFGYLYLVRVPFLAFAFHAAFPILALTTLRPLFENLFRGLGFVEISVVVFFNFLSVVSARISLSVTLLHGDERFEATVFRLRNLSGRMRWLWLTFPAFLVPVVTLCWAPVGSRSWAVAGAAGGLAGGVLFFYLVMAIYAWFLPKGEEPTSLLLSSQVLSKRLLKGPLHRASPLDDQRLQNLWWPGWTWLHNFLRRVLPEEGYFHRETKALHSEHLLAAFAFAAALFAYVWATSFDRPTLPTAAYVFMLVLMLCWGFSGIAFLLDRYRIPVWLVPAALVLLALGPSCSDHYYRTFETTPVSASTPSDVLRKHGPTPIVVAAEGGGIQAAAWTIRVLRGLEAGLGTELRPRFRRSLALISGASGGSVGAMYYGGTFRTDRTYTVEEAEKAARTSSLREVAKGLAGPDLVRMVLPFVPYYLFPHSDRGRALENTFELRARLSKDQGRPILLSSWTRLASAGTQPALIFNATIAETGEPLLFTTSNYPQVPREGIWSFSQRYGNNWDVGVATAVRLSSSFPYVTPAARSDEQVSEKVFHVVDGGYYDNFGMMSLMGWLEDALVGLAEEDRPHKILVLQIQSFPPEEPSKTKSPGWPYQLWAPAQAVLNVRTSAQKFRNAQQFELFKKRWEDQVEVVPVLARYQPKDIDNWPPLSWRLRDDQQNDIDKTWKGRKKEIIRQVRAHFE